MILKTQEMAIVLETIPSYGMVLFGGLEVNRTQPEEAEDLPVEGKTCSIGFSKKSYPYVEDICPSSR